MTAIPGPPASLHRRRAIVALLVVAVIAVISALGWAVSRPAGRSALLSTPVQPDASSARPLQEVRIGYSCLISSLPIFVAQERGLFAAHGIHAALVRYDDDQGLAQALADDRIAVGGYLPTLALVTSVPPTNRRFYFVTTQLENSCHPVSCLLRRTTAVGSEPQLQSLADLAGKRIGIFPRLAYRRTLESMLNAYGIRPESVVILPIDATQQGQLLSSGAIDALYTVLPLGASIIASGIGEMLDVDPLAPTICGKPYPSAQFLMSTAWAEQDADAAARLVRSLDDAILVINAHPGEAKACYRPYLSESQQRAIPLVPDSLFLTSYSYDNQDAYYQRIADKYLEFGILGERFDITGVIYHGRPTDVRYEHRVPRQGVDR